MKKVLCLLLVLTMVLALAACANKTEEDGEETTKADATTEETTEEENPFEEFYEITWLTQLNADYQDGRWDEVELEEKFNVDLQCWAMNSREGEKMAALVAAGDIPDFMFMPAAPRNPEEMYNEELTRSIPLSFYKDYLPGYYELLEKLPIGFDYNLVPGTTDEYLGVTTINIGGCQYFYDATAVNLDWLEAIGYSIPEDKMKPVKMTVEGYEKFNDNLYFAEGGFSFDELNDILKKFTEDDPDGNGLDDTYGMMYLPDGAWAWQNMTQMGLFGFVRDGNYLYKDPVTGDVVPKYAYTPYRDYYAWIADMLQKGYMKPLPGEESWYPEYKEVSLTGKMGILQINGGGYLSLNSETYRVLPPQNILLNGNEDIRFVIGPMFRGPDGKAVDKTYNIDPFGTGTWRVRMVGKQVSDDKLKRIFQMLQYTVFSSEDNYLRYQYGIEGIHWKWAGEPYLSKRIGTPKEELAEKYRGQTRVYTLAVYPSSIERQIYNAEENGYWAYMPYMHANDLFEKYALNPHKYISKIYMGSELYEKYEDLSEEYSEQINTIVADFRTRAENGEIADFNSEWSQYIDQLYAAGLQKYVDEVFNSSEFSVYDPGQKFDLR